MFPLEPIASVQIKRGEVTASNLLPSDAPGPVLFEAHDISSELVNVNIEAIINPSSSSVDALGTLKAGRLRFGSVHAANVNNQAPPRGKADRLQQCHRTGVWGSVNGEFVFKLSGKNSKLCDQSGSPRNGDGSSSCRIRERQWHHDRKNDGRFDAGRRHRALLADRAPPPLN